ncbi:MAG: hypothetical protein KAV87_02380 [Desulfobacteraceae bacterium]|nr:hypothetical protein [Desulfobacteraceae bacterium]
MSKGKQVFCKATRDLINPETGRYTYKGGTHTFTIGKGLPFEKIPNHWEETTGPATSASEVSEITTLLELQLKGMTTGRIVQFIMIYYGVKIDSGQHQETAFRQAMDVIKDPQYKRRPASQIAAGLATIGNAPPDRKDDDSIAPLTTGTAAPVVPAKSNETADIDPAQTGEKLFKDMNADEIDVLSRDDIFAKVKRMYQVDLPNTGNKTVVLNKAIEVEAAALEAKGTGILDRDK